MLESIAGAVYVVRGVWREHSPKEIPRVAPGLLMQEASRGENKEWKGGRKKTPGVK
jgi:hypothetical protein